MARGRKPGITISLEQQIEKAQEKVIKTKAAYDKALKTLEAELTAKAKAKPDNNKTLKAQNSTQQQRDFCIKYIPILEMIDTDPSLKEACAKHSAYAKDEKHGSLINYLYQYFMKDAYKKGIVVPNYDNLVEKAGMQGKVDKPTDEELKALSPDQLLGCMAWHFRRDYFSNGSLISQSIAEGHMLRMMRAYVASSALK